LEDPFGACTFASAATDAHFLVHNRQTIRAHFQGVKGASEYTVSVTNTPDIAYAFAALQRRLAPAAVHAMVQVSIKSTIATCAWIKAHEGFCNSGCHTHYL
jgi:beta-glucosidase-like glycosyl hydrolase